MTRIPVRWVAVGVFAFSSTVNFLDRQLLSAAAPILRQDFHMSNTQYGEVLSAFALAYAGAAPLMGWIIDRIGLNVGVAIACLVWSVGGMATGLMRSFTGLLACRTVLGLGESAGMPSLGKANALYLGPSEFALSLAANHITISLGSAAAPIIFASLMPLYGWRTVFTACGAVGLLWAPLWLLTSRLVPSPREVNPPPQVRVGVILRDARMWSLVLANALVMTVYTVWTNWTTIYFVQEHHLTAHDANMHFAWIPPLFATAGGFFGGWLVARWMSSGVRALHARMRSGWIGGGFVLVTAAVPLMPSPTLAVAAISASFFWCMSLQCNLHVMPIDLFGPANAAFAVSMLACSYGLLQVFLSPVIGAIVDHFGFSPVCVGLSVFPLIGMAVLRAAVGDRTSPKGTSRAVPVSGLR